METKEKFTEQLNKLIPLWIEQEININEGISIENLKKLETDLKFSFEADFIAFLLRVDGF